MSGLKLITEAGLFLSKHRAQCARGRVDLTLAEAGCEDKSGRMTGNFIGTVVSFEAGQSQYLGWGELRLWHPHEEMVHDRYMLQILMHEEIDYLQSSILKLEQ